MRQNYFSHKYMLLNCIGDDIKPKNPSVSNDSIGKDLSYLLVAGIADTRILPPCGHLLATYIFRWAVSGAVVEYVLSATNDRTRVFPHSSHRIALGVTSPAAIRLPAPVTKATERKPIRHSCQWMFIDTLDFRTVRTEAEA